LVACFLFFSRCFATQHSYSNTSTEWPQFYNILIVYLLVLF
jgi:hypothetical protein